MKTKKKSNPTKAELKYRVQIIHDKLIRFAHRYDCLNLDQLLIKADDGQLPIEDTLEILSEFRKREIIYKELERNNA